MKVQPHEDPSSWVIIRSVRFKPVGAEESGLTPEERKKLKALGYLD